MRREPAVYLWEVEQAAGNVCDFTAARTLPDLEGDLLQSSAVERQMQNMGEALAQLDRAFPAIAKKIPNLADIVGFRNILVHGYRDLDYATVWMTITRDVPLLRTQLEALLREVTK